MSLRVAFWNVGNLLEVDPDAKSGPRTKAELEAKIEAVTEVLRGLFDGAGADLIGLAEVGSEPLVERLARNLGDEYVAVFEPSPKPPWPGLTVLARFSAISELARVDAYRPWEGSMPRWLVARCELKMGGEPFLFVVNHWRSRLGGDVAAAERVEAAKQLANLLARSDTTPCAVVVGDFNAEPFEAPFGDAGLRSARHFSGDLWRGAAPACLYNPSWRFLSEREFFEERTDRATSTMTTFAAEQPVVLDQILVSGRALRGGPIALIERSVAIASGHGSTSADAHKLPERWRYTPQRALGVSDHFPVVAEFRIG